MVKVEEILGKKEVPVIALDEEGIITFSNEAFEQAYGWNRKELLGQSVATIIPESMRQAHHIGFSRFVKTKQPTLLGMPLKLPVVCKNGKEIPAEHLIVAEECNGQWRFAASICPQSPQDRR